MMLLSRDVVKKAEEELEKLEPDKLEPDKLTSYQIVEIMYDRIEQTRARGVSYQEIFEKISASIGWKLKLGSFRQYLKKIQVERKKTAGEDKVW